MKSKVQFLFRYSLLLIIFLGMKAEAQEQVYEGFIKDKKVGELVAIREVNDENIKIVVKTKIEAHLLVKISVELNSESTYINQSLMQSSAITKVQNEVKSDVQIVKKNNNYEIDIDGKRGVINEQNLLGADIFYFEEPKNISSVYALATGEKLTIEKDKASVYYFERDGKKEYHKYVNGILSEVEINHTLYTITFKLKGN